MKKCATIIVTYNAMPWLEKCLGSLRNSQLRTDVFLIDNASKDDTISVTRKLFPEVEIVENNDNLGFGAANNLGLKLAHARGYEYFFLLNQDAWVEENTIGNLIAYMDLHQAFGVMSPVHLNGKGDDFDRLFRHFIRNHLPSDDFLDRRGKEPSCCEVGFVNAAAWMLSRQCLEQVGLFHPLFYHYGEDSNYLARVRFEKIKIGVLSETYIYHDREDRKGNPIKSAPKNAFKQASLKILLHPYNVSLGRKGWVEVIYKAYYIANKRKVHGVEFYAWAVKQHREHIRCFRKFQSEGSKGLYLEDAKITH